MNIISRRRFKSLLINSKTQIRYGAIFLSVTLAFHAITTVFAIRLYISWVTRADDSSGVELALVFGILLLAFAVFYVGAFILAIVISHKIYGPFVNIQKMLERYTAGDFSERIKVRKGDDDRVEDLAKAINGFVESIQSRAGQRP